MIYVKALESYVSGINKSCKNNSFLIMFLFLNIDFFVFCESFQAQVIAYPWVLIKL
jgi:hypothetical protein